MLFEGFFVGVGGTELKTATSNNQGKLLRFDECDYFSF